jgi:hypothetical protein
MSLGAADLSTLDAQAGRLEYRMIQTKPEWREHQLKRWVRPDAHNFVRPDWRRFVRPGFEGDHPFALCERKYSPDQPRAPAGGPDGGQWTSGGSDTGNDLSGIFAAGGHHHFPFEVAKHFPKLSDEARAVFKQAKTGPLLDPSSNFYDKEHRAYSAAVKDLFDRYLETKQIDPAKMTSEQAREFLGEIFTSEDPRIRTFRWRMLNREFRRYLGRSRGFE